MEIAVSNVDGCLNFYKATARRLPPKLPDRSDSLSKINLIITLKIDVLYFLWVDVETEDETLNLIPYFCMKPVSNPYYFGKQCKNTKNFGFAYVPSGFLHDEDGGKPDNKHWTFVILS